MPRSLTLADLRPGAVATLGVPELDPGRVRRLAELGIRAGAQVTVLLRTAGGGRVVALAEDRIALDRGTLRRLPVVPTDSGSGA